MSYSWWWDSWTVVFFFTYCLYLIPWRYRPAIAGSDVDGGSASDGASDASLWVLSVDFSGPSFILLQTCLGNACQLECQGCRLCLWNGICARHCAIRNQVIWVYFIDLLNYILQFSQGRRPKGQRQRSWFIWSWCQWHCGGGQWWVRRNV